MRYVDQNLLVLVKTFLGFVLFALGGYLLRSLS